MRTEGSFLKHFKFVFLVGLVVALIMVVTGYRAYLGLTLVVMFGSLALYCMSHPFLKSFAFTVWVFAFVAASMVYPAAFMTWFKGTPYEFDLSILIVPLIQVIMFGMGTTLSLADFGRVAKIPWPVLVGFVLQFSIMPLVGFSLAKAFRFESEVAAGVVLIGSCPGGVASNLMTYLAGGDVALSVTMTSCSTLASPVMTPLMMKLLAGKMVPVPFFGMMFTIINMIIVPIVAGLVANHMLYDRRRLYRRGGLLGTIGVVGILAALLIAVYAPKAIFTIAGGSLGKDGLVVGLLLIGVVALAKLVISVWLKGPENWMDRVLPVVSMAGICIIIAIITAQSRDDLLKIAPFIIIAAILHNFIGYILGYWGARLFRLSESACRTVAIEVGLQNGGMASGLAMKTLASAKAALAPAIFGPWMNVSGSVLATWWHRKPIAKAAPR
ncbi:MAG: bile acid:sodium symporter family protein [Sedimentisphaerales bacterium]|nr:bile acid:sodium symporter family protein [Sedimentisphaerales bacterium]